MTEHEYEREADAAERELADMEERSGKVGDQIDEARKDWEAKVADPSVPGAVGDRDDDDEPEGADESDQEEASAGDDAARREGEPDDAEDDADEGDDQAEADERR